jgi:tripartite-type tricarboxylate transporter receptor subunit TctC
MSASIVRRFTRALLLACLGLFALPALALDADKPLTIMVPYPVGGVSDAIARIFGGPLSRHLGGQTVIVDNLGGVSGSLAAQKVLSAPADGQMLFQASPNELILAPLASKSVKLRAEEFRLVQLISTATMVVYVRKDLPAQTIDELIELARKSKDKPLTYGSVGIGSLYHILVERMQQLTGTAMTHVPYRGGAPLIQDLLGGQIDFAVIPHGAAGQALAGQGKLRLIASLDAKRSELLGNLPTVAESKALKGFSHTIWTGYTVPRQTPEDVVKKLHAALGAVITEPRVRGELQAQYQSVAPALPLAEADKFYAREIATFRTLAQQINLQPQ